MKRKGAARKEGKCPRDAPKDEKCDNCRSKKGACLVAARIAAGHALPPLDEPSTSKPRPTQPVADSDMDIDPPNTRPSRQCQPPEKVKRAAAREIGDFNNAEDHRAILKAIVGNGYEHDESGRRLLRNHAVAIVEQIEGKAKGDLTCSRRCSSRRP